MKRAVAMVVSLVGFSLCFTWVYQGMAAVMEVGGACASGGPYVIAQPCPEGTPLLLLGGLFGGAVFVGVNLLWAKGLGPPLGALWWTVLFCGLGVNFLRFAFDPPGGGGLEWGWLVCGVVFEIMGLAPLAIALPVVGLPRLLVGDVVGVRRPDAVPHSAATITGVAAGPRRAHTGSDGGGDGGRPGGRERATATVVRHTVGRDLVGELERLARLHRDGSLDDDEYERAKEQVLGGGR